MDCSPIIRSLERKLDHLPADPFPPIRFNDFDDINVAFAGRRKRRRKRLPANGHKADGLLPVEGNDGEAVLKVHVTRGPCTPLLRESFPHRGVTVNETDIRQPDAPHVKGSREAARLSSSHMPAGTTEGTLPALLRWDSPRYPRSRTLLHTPGSVQGSVPRASTIFTGPS